MVLAILVETTWPILVLRRDWVAVVSAMLFLLRSSLLQLALAGHGLDPRDVPAQAANLLQALRLSHAHLELQAKELVAELTLLVLELGFGQVAYLFRVHGSLCLVPRDETRPERQLVRRQAHSLGGILRRHALHLEQNLARADHRDPVVGRAFTFAHAGLSRLLGDRLVREQAQPDLAAALDEARHGHAAGLDLPVGDPSRLEHLQPVVAVGQFGAAPRLAAHASALLLAILNLFWHQHKVSS